MYRKAAGKEFASLTCQRCCCKAQYQQVSKAGKKLLDDGMVDLHFVLHVALIYEGDSRKCWTLSVSAFTVVSAVNVVLTN